MKIKLSNYGLNIGIKDWTGDICNQHWWIFEFIKMGRCSVKIWPDRQTCHHPIWNKKELAKILKKNSLDILIGPDTCLFHYQLARANKDWERANEVVAKAKEMGYELSFNGNYYAAYYMK